MGEWRAGMSPSSFPEDAKVAGQVFWEVLTTGETEDPVLFEPREGIEAKYVWGKEHILSRSAFAPEEGQEARPGRVEPMGSRPLAHGYRCADQEAGQQKV